MTKDILDKLQIKNFENLSENNYSNEVAIGMSRDLETLKINDDFSNEDVINNINSSNKNNSYIKLNNNLEENK